MTGSSQRKHLIGALERGSLPELGLHQIIMRVDTGATTSSLHVDSMVTREVAGHTWVDFDLHPDAHHVDEIIHCSAKVLGTKRVKSSSADSEQRYVISTPLRLAMVTRQIKITLTDRSTMRFPMLLGRQAICGTFIVDPEHDYLLTGV